MPETKRAKAMQVALDFKGVEYVAIQGKWTNRIVILGDDIDFDRLTKKLRRKVGHWNIYGVDEVSENWKNAAEEEDLAAIALDKKELECYRSNDLYYIPPFDGTNFDLRLRPRYAHSFGYYFDSVVDSRTSYDHIHTNAPPLPPPQPYYPPASYYPPVIYSNDYANSEYQSCTIM